MLGSRSLEYMTLGVAWADPKTVVCVGVDGKREGRIYVSNQSRIIHEVGLKSIDMIEPSKCLLGDWNGHIHSWDLNTFQILNSYSLTNTCIQDVSVQENVAACASATGVDLVDTRSPSTVSQLRPSGAWSVDLSSAQLVIGYESGWISSIDTRTFHPVWTGYAGTGVISLDVEEDYILISGELGVKRIPKTRSGEFGQGTWISKGRSWCSMNWKDSLLYTNENSICVSKDHNRSEVVSKEDLVSMSTLDDSVAVCSLDGTLSVIKLPDLGK